MKKRKKVAPAAGSQKMKGKAIVRHAYEQVLNTSARLASFALAEVLQSDGPIEERQEVLALDDLAGFAYHARRLIAATGSEHRFNSVEIKASYGQKNQLV